MRFARLYNPVLPASLLIGILSLIGCDTNESSGKASVVNPNSPVANALTDKDGNAYASIRIGSQTWLASNYLCTKYSDGSPISDGGIPSGWQASATARVGAYSLPHYAPKPEDENGYVFGALYNWEAVHDGKFAPSGWHVPTRAEWKTLEKYLLDNGYKSAEPNPGATDDQIARALASKTDWIASGGGNTPASGPDGNDASGFGAKPCGNIDPVTGVYYGKGSVGGFWTSDAYNAEMAQSVSMSGTNGALNFSTQTKEQGNAVRLIKDE